MRTSALALPIAALCITFVSVQSASAKTPSTSQVERIVQRKLPSIGIRHHATVDFCEKTSSRKWKCEVSSKTLVGQTVIATYRGGTIHVKRQSLRDSVGG